MKILREIQENFQDYLLDNNPDFVSEVEKPKEGNEKDRLDIYANAYYFCLSSVKAVHLAPDNLLKLSQTNRCSDEYQ